MKGNESDYDVIIVGSRIAGSLTGILLGEKGYQVLVLDRAHFPSDTLSTHFFRAAALRAFSVVGVYDEVQAAAPHATVNFNVIDGIAFAEPVDRPEDYPFYMCVRRITLDDILVRRLKEVHNVKMIEGARVNALMEEGGKIVSVGWKEKSGPKIASARVVIGADGVRSFVAKEVKAFSEYAEPVNRAMYYAYFSGVKHKEGPAAEFHYRGNNIAYVMACDGDLSMLAVSVPIEKFPGFKRDPEGKLMQELGAMTEIAARLPNVHRQSSVLGSGSIPCYMRIPYGYGWVLVGDAGMAMDPWSGQGIDQASTHAVSLAKYLGDFLSGERDWKASMEAYYKDRNEVSMKAYRRTRKFGRDLRPMTREALAKRGLV
ncbi:NAD(P)/FAD-dependent oxidoreductase [Chloroflexota bacterium]